MSNPSPRPALRKAPDADVHPAIPDINSATIDLRTQAAAPAILTPEVQITHEPELASPTKAPAKAKSKKATKRASDKAKADKRKAKRIALRVTVPRSVRSELRATAKARGTSVDDVVSTVLEGWLDK